jgi:uncharacterized protein (DUF1499 family)
VNRFASLRTVVTLSLGLTVIVGLSSCASSGSSAGDEHMTFDRETGLFAPCPDSPNCVSTQAQDEEHGMPSLSYTDSQAEAKQRMVDIVNAMPRSTIVGEADDYLHVEFRSRIFRFVDDVELYFDDANKTVQFRSASRVGYSDMGVNRNRMTEISQQFAQ